MRNLDLYMQLILMHFNKIIKFKLKAYHNRKFSSKCLLLKEYKM